MSKPIDFTVHSGIPITVEVVKNGVTYLVKLGLAVMGVDDMETENNGLPVFNIQASLTTATIKK